VLREKEADNERMRDLLMAARVEAVEKLKAAETDLARASERAARLEAELWEAREALRRGAERAVEEREGLWGRFESALRSDRAANETLLAQERTSAQGRIEEARAAEKEARMGRAAAEMVAGGG
jgi:hypothetical protein